MHCCCNVITMTTYIASKPAAPMLCALVCTMIIIGGTLASLEVQILIGHITSVDVESWRQQQKLFLSCEFFSQITFVFFSVLPGNPKITATQFLILSHFYFSRFSEIFEINIFNASPSFSIIYWIMLFWNYWTTQNCTEKCLLCLWLKCKKSLIFRCCPVCRESLFTPFFFQKREALRLSLIWPDITVSSVTVWGRAWKQVSQG